MMQVPVAAITKSLVQVEEFAVTKCPVTVRAGLPKVMLTPVLLVSVILVIALTVPTAVGANVMLFGLSDTLLVPVPLNPTSCGLEGSLSLMMTAPFFAPVEAGVKVTPMVQLAFAFSLAPEAGQV